jgi:hypothetical protein
MRTAPEREELQYKLQMFRTMQPLSVTGDIANHISVIFNKSKKSADSNIYTLIDKIQQFCEYWSSRAEEAEKQNKKNNLNQKDVMSPQQETTDLLDMDWKDHDQMELEEALLRLNVLESQLQTSGDLLVKSQVKCAEYDMLIEKNEQLQEENDELRKKLSILSSPDKDSSTFKKENTSMKNKFSEKVEELFQLKNAFGTITKSSSTTSFLQNISSVASPSQILSAQVPSNTNSNVNFLNIVTTPSTLVNSVLDDKEEMDNDDINFNQNYSRDPFSLLSPSQEENQRHSQKDSELLFEIESFQRQISSLMHEKNEIMRTNMTLDEEVHDLQSRIIDLENTIDNLKSEKDTLLSQKQSVSQQKEALEETKVKTDSDYKNQMKINKVLIATVHKLELSVKELTSKQENVSRENSALNTEIITNKNQLYEQNERIHLLTKQINHFEKHKLQMENEKIILENEKHDYYNKFEARQKDLISEKERNATLQSDYDVVVNEKQRISYALELTQKKLIQRDQQLEELLTLSSTGDEENNNAGVAFPRLKAAIGNISLPSISANAPPPAPSETTSRYAHSSSSPLPPGAVDADNNNGDGNNNSNAFMKFARSAKQLSMVGSKKFKDAFGGNLPSETDNNEDMNDNDRTTSEPNTGRKDNASPMRR